MNIAKKLLTCALIFSSVSSFAAADADAENRGFLEKAGRLFSGSDWDKNGELVPGEVAKTLGVYAAIAGFASYAVYKIVQTIKERAEQAKQIAFLKPKFEKFVANYQQLLEEAVRIAQTSLEGKPVKNALYSLLLAQKKQGGHEYIEIISEKMGEDIGAILEKFVKDFDAVVATPAGNKQDRLMAALTNLGAFMDWVFTGQFNGAQIPAAEPVAKSVVKAEPTSNQLATKEKAARAPRKALRSKR